MPPGSSYQSPYPLPLHAETRLKLEILKKAMRIPVSALVRMAVDLMWDQEKDKPQPGLAKLSEKQLSELVRSVVDALTR